MFVGYYLTSNHTHFTLITDESLQLKRLYLASKSPRRTEILRNLGLTFTVIAPDIDESVRPHEQSHEYVLRLCAEKALAGLHLIAAELAGNELAHSVLIDNQYQFIVLAADTSVCINDQILGKPDNSKHAISMLHSLEGRSHLVHTGVAVAIDGQIHKTISTTRVWMKSLTDFEIEAYVSSGESMDKAGGYGIQGLGGAFISRIDGSYTGVMGLPVYETTKLLNGLF